MSKDQIMILGLNVILQDFTTLETFVFRYLELGITAGKVRHLIPKLIPQPLLT